VTKTGTRIRVCKAKAVMSVILTGSLV